MTISRIGFLQYQVAFGDREANFRLLEPLLAETEADLLVLPELGATGYEFRDCDEVLLHAEPFAKGPTAEFLLHWASRQNTILVMGYPELDGNRVYNACMLVTPDGQFHNYRKIHLFSRETELFSPGDAPPPVIETRVGRIGLMICFDWFFPETARLLALSGAQLIAHPSNLVLGYCQRAMYARCVENRVFAITANRIGTEERAGRRLTFTGGSQILDFSGNTLVSAPPDQAFAATAEVDLSQASNKRITPENDLLLSRRPELYGSLVTEKPAAGPGRG